MLTLVERGGSARSFLVETLRHEELIPTVKANLDRETGVITDEGTNYCKLNTEFPRHDTVDHSREEYHQIDRRIGVNVNTNTVEGFHSVFKRRMRVVYRQCEEKHLHRYLAELDFRYSNRPALGVEDQERASLAHVGTAGKRLLYWDSSIN